MTATDGTTDPDAAGWSGILRENEEILWQGQPDPAFDFWGESPIDIAFGMTLAGGPLVPMGVLIPVLGVKALIFAPVLLIGLWMLVGKALWRSYRLRHSWYSISTQRVFVATDLFGRRRLHDLDVTPRTEIDEVGGECGGLLLSAPEGYGLLLERLPKRQALLSLLWRVQDGAPCRPLSTMSG